MIKRPVSEENIFPGLITSRGPGSVLTMGALLVPQGGFEPPQTDPESVVLPLHNRGIITILKFITYLFTESILVGTIFYFFCYLGLGQRGAAGQWTTWAVGQWTLPG